MSYQSENMRLLGGVPGQQMFLYRTADADTGVETSGYFDQAVEHYTLSDGDIILSVTGFGTTNALNAYVANVTSGVSTVTALA